MSTEQETQPSVTDEVDTTGELVNKPNLTELLKDENPTEVNDDELSKVDNHLNEESVKLNELSAPDPQPVNADKQTGEDEQTNENQNLTDCKSTSDVVDEATPKDNLTEPGIADNEPVNSNDNQAEIVTDNEPINSNDDQAKTVTENEPVDSNDNLANTVAENEPIDSNDNLANTVAENEPIDSNDNQANAVTDNQPPIKTDEDNSNDDDVTTSEHQQTTDAVATNTSITDIQSDDIHSTATTESTDEPSELANVLDNDQEPPLSEDQFKETDENNQNLLVLESINAQQQSELAEPQIAVLDSVSNQEQQQTQPELSAQEQEELNQALNQQQQQQIIIQQTQNPETGELLFVLQGENGEEIAIPPEAIQNGFVQIRDSEGNEQLIALGLPEDTTGSLIGGQNLLRTENSADLSEQIFLQTQQPLEVSADIINTLGAASIPLPQQLTPTTASTNVVQSLETPRVSTQETTVTGTDSSTAHKDTIAIVKTATSIDHLDKQQQLTIDESNTIKKDESNATIDLIQNPINNVTLENMDMNMVSNATLLTSVDGDVQDQNSYVIMAGDNQLTTLGNLSNQLSTVSGQTFFIETSEGLLQCNTVENGALQFIQTTSDDLSTASVQNQFITIQSDLQDNQIIETINENGQYQPIQFTVSSTNNDEIQLMPVNNHQTQSSLLDLKNSSNLASAKSTAHSSKLTKNNNSVHLIPTDTTSSSPTKTVTNPNLNTNKKQNVSIIQNINHQSHLNHQPQQIITSNNANNPSSNRSKRAQQLQPQRNQYNIAIPVSNAKSSSSSITETNLLLTTANNNDDSKRTNYAQHYLQTSNNTSSHSVHVNKQSQQQDTTNPLSSSRRTYSRKNILWLNPVQPNSNNNNTSTTASDNKTEAKEDELQLKIDSNDKKSITITPVKEIPNTSPDCSSRSSPSQIGVKKGTITISTIIDNKQINRNSNVYNQVKIVPSESQSRLLKNVSSSQISDLKSCSSVDDDLSLADNDDKMEIEICSTDSNSSNNKKTSISLDNDDKPSKRLKRNSFTDETTKDEQEIKPENKSSQDNEEKTKIDQINSIINEPVIDQSLPVVKHESGRRKSPIKPLKDCETNFDEETKEIELDDEMDLNYDDDINDLDSEQSEIVLDKAAPLVSTKSQEEITVKIEQQQTTIRITRSRNASKSESKPESRSESKSENKSESKPESRSESKLESNPESRPESKSESKPEIKPESKPEIKPERKSERKSESKSEGRSERKSESKSEDESTIDVKRRRSGRLSKTIEETTVKVENIVEKAIEKEEKINKVSPADKLEKKIEEEKQSKSEELINNDTSISSSLPKLRRGRSYSKKVEDEPNVSKENATKDDTKQDNVKSKKVKEIHQPKEPEKRIDEDSVKFDLLFKSQSATKDDQQSKSIKQTKTKINKNISNDSNQTVLPKSTEAKVESTITTRTSKTTRRNSSVNISTNVTTQSEERSLAVDSTPPKNSKKRSLRSTSAKVEETNSSKQPKVSIPTETRRRQTISSIKDVRDGKEFYDEKLNTCEMHIRYQTPTSTKSGSAIGHHTCQKCAFTTNRINLLIQHHKTDCQIIQTQMNYWQDEIKQAQQGKAPISKKKRILDLNDSSGKWDLELDSIDNKLDYMKRESSDDEGLLEDSDSRKFPFEENEVVWVELKEEAVKWPALVQKIQPNTNQVLVFLIDAPDDGLYSKKSLYSVDDVITFNNADQNIRFLDETKSKYDDSIVKVVQKAEDYTRKKLLGEQLDVSKLSKRLGDRQLSDDSRASKSIEVNNVNLLKFIKSGKIESHLLGIYKESVKSDLHANFKSATKASTSSSSNNYGPFDHKEDRDNLFSYCLHLFESNFKVDRDFDVVDYMFDVWIPSAIIKAINRLYRVSMEEAENIFNRKTVNGNS